METIFDHNITAEEFSILFGEDRDRTEFEQTYNERTEDQWNTHLFYLMSYRKSPNAKQYFDRIKNESAKFSIQQLSDITHD